jgi:hypothetical protein
MVSSVLMLTACRPETGADLSHQTEPDDSASELPLDASWVGTWKPDIRATARLLRVAPETLTNDWEALPGCLSIILQPGCLRILGVSDGLICTYLRVPSSPAATPAYHDPDDPDAIFTPLLRRDNTMHLDATFRNTLGQFVYTKREFTESRTSTFTGIRQSARGLTKP